MKTIANKIAFLTFPIILILSAGVAIFGQTRPDPTTISGGILNGRAVSLPKPVYPSDLHGLTGEIKVQVLIGHNGRVESATVYSGIKNARLRASAVEAAKQARFSPTLLHTKPVKVSGTIIYTFPH